MPNRQVIDIPLDDNSRDFRQSTYSAPRSILSESEKIPSWYYRSLQYYLSFYNQPIGAYRFGALNVDNDRSTGNVPLQERFQPIQHMIRMVMYYLGKQPNLDNAWMTQNLSSSSLQSIWLKGQDTSEFVNYFRGLIMQRLTNAKFNGRSLSKGAVSKKTELIEKMNLKQLLKPIMEDVEKDTGISFNPLPGAEPQISEEVEDEVTKNFYDEAAELASYLANGIYFTNGWYDSLKQQFMHSVICGQCNFEHFVEEGLSLQKTLMPWQVIQDSRVDNDYGRFDQFRGKIEQYTPTEIARRYPQLSVSQLKEIDSIARDDKQYQAYNANTSNVLWWGNNLSGNTVSVVTMYFRCIRDIGKVKDKNRFDQDVVRKVKEGEKGYYQEDLYQVDLIGDRFMTNFGLADNVISDPYNRNRPMFPISIFKPNMFAGENVSEVGRIHKLQDELDMLDYKMRDMIGKAKGKTYLIWGDKIPAGLRTKELFESLGQIGFQVVEGSGIPDDPNSGKSAVELLDFSLDPSLYRIAELYKERVERMGRIMSTSPISLGQEYKYIGAGQAASAISQNTVGVTYILDGFLDYVVINMRYAANQQKMLKSQKETDEIAMLVGDQGVKWLQFTKSMRWEEMYIELVINDMVDEKGMESMKQIALGFVQNQMMSPSTYVKILQCRSYSEMLRVLDKDARKMEKQRQEAQLQDGQVAMATGEQQMMWKTMMEELKQHSENYRTEIKIASDQGMQLREIIANLIPPADPSQEMGGGQQGGQGAPMQQQAQVA